jgi:hypothetical protein
MSDTDLEDHIPSVRPEFEQIREEFEVDKEKSDDEVIILKNHDVLFRSMGFDMDFNIGKEVMGVQIETPNTTSRLMTEEIVVQGKSITIKGLRKHEHFEMIA